MKSDTRKTSKAGRKRTHPGGNEVRAHIAPAEDLPNASAHDAHIEADAAPEALLRDASDAASPSTADASPPAADLPTPPPRVADAQEVRRSRIQLYVGVFAFILFAALIANGYSYVILSRNGRALAAPGVVVPTLSAASYAQTDERWGGDPLGNSSDTMAQSGCLVCCVATALDARGIDVTPADVNRALTDAGAIDENGRMTFPRISDAYPGIDAKAPSTFKQEDLDAYLLAGKVPIVKVKTAGGVQHWVAIVGADEKTYLAMDPLVGDVVPLTKYESRVYALRVLL